MLSFLFLLLAFPAASQNTYNFFYTSFFQFNREFLHGFGNGYAKKASVLSSRCATDDAQYDFFAMTG